MFKCKIQAETAGHGIFDVDLWIMRKKYTSDFLICYREDIGLQFLVHFVSRSRGQQGKNQGQSKGQKVMTFQLSPTSNLRPDLDSLDNFQSGNTIVLMIAPLVAEIWGFKYQVPPPFRAYFCQIEWAIT